MTYRITGAVILSLVALIHLVMSPCITSYLNVKINLDPLWVVFILYCP